MQNIIIPKIQRNVPNPLDARVVYSIFVREENTISALQVFFGDVFSLLDLRSRRDVELYARALIEDILYQRGAVEFLRGKPCEQFSLSVMKTHCAVHVRYAQQFITLCNHVFHFIVFGFFNGKDRGIGCVNVRRLVLIIGLIPAAALTQNDIIRSLFRTAKDRIGGACAGTDIYVAARATYVLCF